MPNERARLRTTPCRSADIAYSTGKLHRRSSGHALATSQRHDFLVSFRPKGGRSARLRIGPGKAKPPVAAYEEAALSVENLFPHCRRVVRCPARDGC